MPTRTSLGIQPKGPRQGRKPFGIKPVSGKRGATIRGAIKASGGSRKKPQFAGRDEGRPGAPSKMRVPLVKRAMGDGKEENRSKRRKQLRKHAETGYWA